MSSSPLFMSVAESTEILRPITQFGCAQAASGVTLSSASRGVSRNGPPEAVSSTRLTPGGATPARAPCGRHWKMALCSLSIGSSVAPERLTAASSSGPAMTRDSLLASSRRLPACAAASVERRPAAPTIAAMTHCTSGSRASSSSAPAPAEHARSGRLAAQQARQFRAPRSHRRAPRTAGGRRAPGAPALPRCVCAASATSRKRSGCRASTSSVLSPTEPVEPSTATPIMLLPQGRVSPRNSTGAAPVMLSIRSITPPCPGNSVPLSFTPA